MSTELAGMTHARVRTYIYTFALSAILTLAAYFASRLPSGASVVITAVMILAIVQFGVHMLGFLHVGFGTALRWKLQVTLFLIFVVAILVGGTLWIMLNLNTRTSPQQQMQYMNQESGI